MLELEARAPVAMEDAGDGWFAVEVEAHAGTRYRFRIGDRAVPDPASRAQTGGVHGWSVVDDPDRYRWRTTDWRGRPWRETVLYEIHPGLAGGFRGIAERLPALADLGITAVELMPIGAFAGTRNWGYDGVLPYAPSESYGAPDDLRALVDRAHELGLMVFLDVVYNHFGPDGNYLSTYARGFFDEHAHTPWGGAVAVSKPAVSRYFVDNALMWLRDYRIDGLRFDAVHAIADNGFLDDMAREIRATLPERHVHLVLENEANDADRLASGRYDAQWNDDFHNTLHVLLTGEDQAYYADFAERPTERLARCLSEGFVYQGDPSPNHEGEPRGTPSAHLPPTAFVSFLQNHDQIGNRAFGDRLTTLVDTPRLRVATALLLLCPQVPLMFMGDEIGSRTPFLFFTDFHDDLADAVREGRRREFAKFADFADETARERIPDPNAIATYDRSRPEPASDAAQWRSFYRDLIAQRFRHVVPALDDARSLGATVLGNGSVAARWRIGDRTLTLAFNLGTGTVAFPRSDGEIIWAQGEAGAPASFVATIDG